MSLVAIKLELPSGEDLEQTIYLTEVPFPGDTVMVDTTEMIVVRRTYHALQAVDLDWMIGDAGARVPVDKAPQIPSVVLQVRLKK